MTTPGNHLPADFRPAHFASPARTRSVAKNAVIRGRRPIVRSLSRTVSLGVAAALSVAFVRAAQPAGQPELSRFVGKYCLKCHDSETRKADHDFTSLRLPLSTEADLITAKDIIDQLTLREMPQIGRAHV